MTVPPTRGRHWRRFIHCLSSLCRDGTDAIDGPQEGPLVEAEVNCVSACCQSRATETNPSLPHTFSPSSLSVSSNKSLNDSSKMRKQ